MIIFLRGFKERDLERILEIEKASFPDPWGADVFIRHYRINPDGFLVAVEDGEVVGYAVARMETTFEVTKLRVRRRCHLVNLAVAPKSRNRGIGSRLLKETIKHARSRGAREVYLEVRAKNVLARRFYKKRGFMDKGYRKGYYGADDAVIMTLYI